MAAGAGVLSGIFSQARGLTRDQKRAFMAAWLGWAMDAFDFFLIVFVFQEIAQEFGVSTKTVQWGTTLTLFARPFGAAIFGLLADRYGRRTVLMFDVAFYSVMEFLTGFSTSVTMLLVLRFLFGIGMGGEWGIGASLAMEKIPAAKRGFYSGLLQQGYPLGYLFAALAYYAVGNTLGWRWLFWLGAIPALLTLYIRSKVEESEAWEETRQRGTSIGQVLRNRAVIRRFFYLVVLMTLFNFLSHGTQDEYPTFLKEQHHYSADLAVLVAVVYNIGALIGGVTWGALSERIGRRRTVVICTLVALPAVPLFAFSSSLGLIMLGSFLMQFLVQGAWGVIPAHLTELSPDEIRGFYPGVTYQLGNLLASTNLIIQTSLAEHYGGNFGLGMAIVIVPVLLLTALVTWRGPENRGAEFGKMTEPIDGRERKEAGLGQPGLQS
jgi:SHS family lactate transporter-like MFS transporter